MFSLCPIPKKVSAFCTHKHALKHILLNKCVFTLRKGLRERAGVVYVRGQESRREERKRAHALSSSLLPVQSAILLSLFIFIKETIFIRDRRYRVISLFDMFHKIN